MTAVAEAPPFAPGIYDIPEDVYHADPVPGGSLSVSGAKKLLKPSCPAKFHYEREHPAAPSAAMELGTAAHKLVLGTGAPIEVVAAKDWKTKAAQETAAAARAAGKVPLLAAAYQKVQAMAEAIRRHPIASALLNPENGDPERSIFWSDPEFGIWRRSRLDWLPHPRSSGRVVIPDYKTCASANLDAISKAVYDYRYHMQDPWYREAVEAMWPGIDTAFVFIFQETAPPYLITVVQLDETATQIGAARNREACEIFRDCTEVDIWPSYTDEIELVSLPPWAQR